MCVLCSPTLLLNSLPKFSVTSMHSTLDQSVVPACIIFDQALGDISVVELINSSIFYKDIIDVHNLILFGFCFIILASLSHIHIYTLFVFYIYIHIYIYIYMINNLDDGNNISKKYD